LAELARGTKSFASHESPGSPNIIRFVFSSDRSRMRSRHVEPAFARLRRGRHRTSNIQDRILKSEINIKYQTSNVDRSLPGAEYGPAKRWYRSDSLKQRQRFTAQSSAQWILLGQRTTPQ